MDMSAAVQHTATRGGGGAPPQHMVGAPAQKLMRRGFQMELLQQAKVLCDNQDYVDLTIYCEDGVVRAHQMLLATASPFLKLLFQTSPLYGVEEISLILPEVKACLVQALVHFVYTGTVVSKEDHFYSLMKLVYALNINASIEAESTNERPTTFTAPLIPPQIIEPPPKFRMINPTLPGGHQLPLQPLQQQQLVMPSLPTHPVPPSLPTHPVPPAKMARMSANVSASSITLQQPPPGVMAQAAASAAGQTAKHMSIQLPSQPLPMSNVVNGAVTVKTETMTAQPTAGGSYVAVDPNTGMSYKVELPNGPISTSSGDVNDPLAAIMNETIFTEQATGEAIILSTSRATIFGDATHPAKVLYLLRIWFRLKISSFPVSLLAGTVYTENGQLVYATGIQPNLPTVPNPQVQPPTAQPTAKKGKKRSAAAANGDGANGGGGGHKANAILAESVDDLPCAPDDEDLNTPYPCDQCNKTIKGRVMLQAHQYQEHYENPEIENLDIGDKHACRVCLKLFTRNSDVKAHILRVHCGDRRYPCTMCGKRFKESTHLRKHLYTHTGKLSDRYFGQDRFPGFQFGN